MWWIQSVYVHPEHRRRGYYRLLYHHVREAARKEGAAGLRLYADDSNLRAHTTVRSCWPQWAGSPICSSADFYVVCSLS